MRIVDLVGLCYLVCSTSLADFLPLVLEPPMGVQNIIYHTLLAGIRTGAEVPQESGVQYDEGKLKRHVRDITNPEVRPWQWKDLTNLILDMPKTKRMYQSCYSFILLVAEHTKICFCCYNFDRKKLPTSGSILPPFPSTWG